MLQILIRRMEKILSWSRLGIALYAKPYRAVVLREWSMLDLPDNATILNVGCGAIPFTAIWLARLKHCQVYALDIDLQAVRRARRVVRKLGLDTTIKVHHGTVNASLPPFDAAIIAMQVRPLKQTIDTLWMTQTAQQVIRRPNDAYRHAYEPLPGGIHIRAEVRHHLRAFESSVLLKR